MPKAHLRSLATILILAAALLLPAIAEAERAGDRPLTDALRTQIVQTSYANLSRYVVNPDRPIHFTLSDFQTLTRNDLRQTQIFDLISVPGGDLLELNRKERHLVPTGEKWVEWEPSWIPRVGSYLETDQAQQLGLATARAWDVLKIAAKDDPELLEVRSASSFNVTLRFEDRTRTYRAMALWMSDHVGESFDFRLEDPVIGRIDEAIGEALPPGGLTEMNQAIGIATIPEGPTPESWTCCWANKKNINQPFAFSSTDDHITGSHYSSGTFRTTCDCGKSCFNQCYQQVVSGVCADTGGLMYVYFHNTGANISVQSNFAGLGQPVTCNGGYGCAVRYCLLPIFCSVSVGVSVSGANVSVSASPSAAVTWKASGGGTCNTCVLAPPTQCLSGGAHIPRVGG